jgi:glycosyltransferase involved in cell wall biosynthesis
MVHATYREPGGEDISVRDESLLLRSAGATVDLVTLPSPDLPGVNLLRAVRELKEKIARDRFDVVHVQNFFPSVTPAVYREASRRGLPVVQAVRNYRHTCIAGTHIRRGRQCTLCTFSSALPGVRHACYRASRVQSLGAAAVMAGHRRAGTWQSAVRMFLPVSQHVADTLAEVASADRVQVKPNFAWDNGLGTGAGGYAVCAGRLTPEKGALKLVSDWAKNPLLPDLLIVGDGPEREAIEMAARLDPRVRCIGAVESQHVTELMGNAAMVIAPWLWQEPFGRVIPEALSRGTPVVMNDLAGPRTTLGLGAHARFYEAGEPESLAIAIASITDDCRQAARRRYEAAFTPARNLLSLQRAYDVAVNG